MRMTRRLRSQLLAFGLTIAALLLAGCSTDVSRDGRYQRLIGRSVSLNRPQVLWKKEGAFRAEGTDYLITDANFQGPSVTRIADLPTGTPVLVVAVRRNEKPNGDIVDYAIVQTTVPTERPEPLFCELRMSETRNGIRMFPW